mgnify:CR=1 FL=1
MSESEKKKRKSKVDLTKDEPAEVTNPEPVEEAAPKSKRKSKKLNAEQVEAATKVEEPASVAEPGEEQGSSATGEASSPGSGSMASVLSSSTMMAG